MDEGEKGHVNRDPDQGVPLSSPEKQGHERNRHTLPGSLEFVWVFFRGFFFHLYYLLKVFHVNKLTYIR